MVMTCLSCLLRRGKASPGKQCLDADEEVSGIPNIKRYSYKELSVATGNFSVANKIGEGGFGSVYKAVLKEGSLAAVKVLSSESRQGIKEFLTEIDIISVINHENLVKLLGCCVEGDHRILVYEYLENNCLDRRLLGRARDSIHFSWKTRCEICIGIASGLAYLHEIVEPHIVHRDIKASNILLDMDFTPKIADFGLAKLLPPNLTHVSTRVAGTLGYLAPEYAVQGQLRRKSDIYSFGILLLEIVCGRRNTDRRLPEEEQLLLLMAWRLYECGKLLTLVDPLLNGDYEAEEATRFLMVSFLCTQEYLKLRPSMSTVVMMLKGEMDVDDKNIAQPGFINDPANLKIRSSTEKAKLKDSLSSESPLNNSSPSSTWPSCPSMTFTAISERST